MLQAILELVLELFASAGKDDPPWMRVVGCIVWAVLLCILALLVAAWLLGWFE